MTEKHLDLDPTGLIREAYRIDGIGAPECRSIFLDWLLGLPSGTDASVAAKEILASHADKPSDHPMTQVLNDAVSGSARARRRGGAMGRRKN